MLSDLLQVVGQALFEVVFYYVGWLVIPVVSCGRWHCDPLFTNIPKHEARWGGLFHYRRESIYFTSEGTAVIGAIFCLITVCIVIGIAYGF
jgi:hypothetical protein